MPGTPEDALLARVRGFLPFVLGLDLLLLTVLVYLVLDFAVGRPLRSTEAAVEQLGRLELDLPPVAQGGPLLSRIQSALSRMAEALRREQALTRSQLEELRQANARLARAQTELVVRRAPGHGGQAGRGRGPRGGQPAGGDPRLPVRWRACAPPRPS